MIACPMRDVSCINTAPIMLRIWANALRKSLEVDVDERVECDEVGNPWIYRPWLYSVWCPTSSPSWGSDMYPAKGHGVVAIGRKRYILHFNCHLTAVQPFTGRYMLRKVSCSKSLRAPRAINSQSPQHHGHRHCYHRQWHLRQGRTLARYPRYSIIEFESSLLAITQIGKNPVREAV